MRVVSLLPSATEIVHGLGAGESLVGRSEECDFPAEVRDLPVVMRARAWDGDRPSSAVDARVQQTRSAGESLYELDLEQLRRLRPELLLTQDLCGVCSVTDQEVRAACAASGVSPRVVSLQPRTLEEVWDSVETVGDALGIPDRSRALADRLRARARAPAPPPPDGPKTVAVVEWLDPPILAGLWASEMVRAAGGTCLAMEPGAPGLRTTWSAIRAAAPDLVVLSPCSYSVERTRRELATSPLCDEISRCAAPLGLWIADEAYFSRPGPRLADGVELLRALVTDRSPAGPMPVERWGA